MPMINALSLLQTFASALVCALLVVGCASNNTTPPKPNTPTPDVGLVEDVALDTQAPQDASSPDTFDEPDADPVQDTGTTEDTLIEDTEEPTCLPEPEICPTAECPTHPAIHETFGRGNIAFDLHDTTLIFTPDGLGSYTIERHDGGAFPDAPGSGPLQSILLKDLTLVAGDNRVDVDLSQSLTVMGVESDRITVDATTALLYLGQQRPCRMVGAIDRSNIRAMPVPVLTALANRYEFRVNSEAYADEFEDRFVWTVIADLFGNNGDGALCDSPSGVVTCQAATQLRLFSDGHIEMHFRDVYTEKGLVGIFGVSNNTRPENPVDLSAQTTP